MYRVVYGECKACHKKFPNTVWHELLNPDTDNQQQPCPGCGAMQSINEIKMTVEYKEVP